MRRAYGLLLWVLLLLVLWVKWAEAACPPTRSNSYVAGTVIEPSPVNSDFNTLYETFQNGIGTDCLSDNAVTSAKIATGGVTSADILDGTITTADLAFTPSGQVLPAGAVFMMLSGSCPAWTTDVSATYANLFMRISPTAAFQAGSDTHTHTGPSHSHTVPASSAVWGQTIGGVNGMLATWDASTTSRANTDAATSSSGTADTGSSSNVPAYVSAKLCQVN